MIIAKYHRELAPYQMTTAKYHSEHAPYQMALAEYHSEHALCNMTPSIYHGELAPYQMIIATYHSELALCKLALTKYHHPAAPHKAALSASAARTPEEKQPPTLCLAQILNPRRPNTLTHFTEAWNVPPEGSPRGWVAPITPFATAIDENCLHITL